MHPQSTALRALADRWQAVPAAERANFQSYAIELCDALGIARPQPRGSGYEFEFPVTTTDRRTGRDTVNFITIGLLPDRIREAYGFAPVPPPLVRKALVAGGAAYIKRAVMPLLPARVRTIRPASP